MLCQVKKVHYFPLQSGLNFLVDGNVGLLEAVDQVGGAGNLAEVKIAADVVILVERAENAFDLGAFHAEISERGKECEAPRDSQIFLDNLAQRHDLNPNVRSRISVRRVDVKQICLLHLSEGLAEFRGSVLGAEKRTGRSLDSLGLIEVGN